MREWAAKAPPNQLNVLYKCGLHSTAFLSGFRAHMMRETMTVAEIKFEIARQVDLNKVHAKRLHVDFATEEAARVKAVTFVDGARWVRLKGGSGGDL